MAGATSLLRLPVAPATHAPGAGAASSVASTSGSAVVRAVLPVPPWRPARVPAAGRSVTRPRYCRSVAAVLSVGSRESRAGTRWGLGLFLLRGRRRAHALGGPGMGGFLSTFARPSRELPAGLRGRGDGALEAFPAAFRGGCPGRRCSSRYRRPSHICPSPGRRPGGACSHAFRDGRGVCVCHFSPAGKTAGQLSLNICM